MFSREWGVRTVWAKQSTPGVRCDRRSGGRRSAHRHANPTRRCNSDGPNARCGSVDWAHRRPPARRALLLVPLAWTHVQQRSEANNDSIVWVCVCVCGVWEEREIRPEELTSSSNFSTPHTELNLCLPCASWTSCSSTCSSAFSHNAFLLLLSGCFRCFFCTWCTSQSSSSSSTSSFTSSSSTSSSSSSSSFSLPTSGFSSASFSRPSCSFASRDRIRSSADRFAIAVAQNRWGRRRRHRRRRGRRFVLRSVAERHRHKSRWRRREERLRHRLRFRLRLRLRRNGRRGRVSARRNGQRSHFRWGRVPEGRRGLRFVRLRQRRAAAGRRQPVHRALQDVGAPVERRREGDEVVRVVLDVVRVGAHQLRRRRQKRDDRRLVRCALFSRCCCCWRRRRLRRGGGGRARVGHESKRSDRVPPMRCDAMRSIKE